MQVAVQAPSLPSAPVPVQDADLPDQAGTGLLVSEKRFFTEVGHAMWQLVYDTEDQKWNVKEFTRSFQVDDPDNFFHFYAEAERTAKQRNQPPTTGIFWSEGDDRE